MEFHHNIHFHPGPAIASGITSGQFTIPTQGETVVDVIYRLILTVTDSRGGVSKTSIDIDPRVVTINLETNPLGLTLNLDGQPVTTPHTQQFVSGLMVGLTAPVSQTLNNTSYTFTNWTQEIGAGGGITISDINTTYTAIYSLPPDLTLLSYSRPITIYGTTNITLVVDVMELNSTSTGGPIVLKITKDSKAKLTFNPATTSLSGKQVQNSAWTFDDSSDPNYYILTTNQVILGGGQITFGLAGVLTPGPTRGTSTISLLITEGSGGDESVYNNSTSSKIDYFNK